MAERVKKYKRLAQTSEREAAALGRQVDRLGEEVRALREELAVCAVTPAQAARDRELGAQLEASRAEARGLEHRVGVLSKKVETDKKSFERALAGNSREKAALRRQAEALRAELGAKDL
ncbi:unnamed protein product, partial [Ostreobium quekettii]